MTNLRGDCDRLGLDKSGSKSVVKERVDAENLRVSNIMGLTLTQLRKAAKERGVASDRMQLPALRQCFIRNTFSEKSSSKNRTESTLSVDSGTHIARFISCSLFLNCLV